MDTILGSWQTPPITRGLCRQQHVRATILPFSIDTRFQRVYFLLGLGRSIMSWPEGSNRWSDFGGVPQKNDRDYFDAAAREFVEETLGVVRYFEHDNTYRPRKTWKDISESLRRGEYFKRIQISLNTGVFVVTFMKQIPWDPKCILRFRHCRLLLGGLYKQLRGFKMTNQEYKALYPINSRTRHSRHQWIIHHRAVYYDYADKDAKDKRVIIREIHREHLDKYRLYYWSVPQIQMATSLCGKLISQHGLETLMPSCVAVFSDLFRCLALEHPCHFVNHGILRGFG
jgi:hypothetical protein